MPIGLFIPYTVNHASKEILGKENIEFTPIERRRQGEIITKGKFIAAIQTYTPRKRVDRGNRLMESCKETEGNTIEQFLQMVNENRRTEKCPLP